MSCRSILDNFGINQGKLVIYPTHNLILEDVVREIIRQNGLTEVYLVPQSRYVRGPVSCLRVESIYQEKATSAEAVLNNSFEALREISGEQVLNLAGMARRGDEEVWIPQLDLEPGAKKIPIGTLTNQIACNLGLGDGFLVDSGEGLHFWGLQAVTQRHWEEMWGKVLKRIYGEKRDSDPLCVDNNWVMWFSHYTPGPYTLRVTNWPGNNKPTPKPIYYCRER
ncbi:MAG: hypothetical protein AAB897_03235 [Patescibacteria group bacterium]